MLAEIVPGRHAITRAERADEVRHVIVSHQGSNLRDLGTMLQEGMTGMGQALVPQQVERRHLASIQASLRSERGSSITSRRASTSVRKARRSAPI